MPNRIKHARILSGEMPMRENGARAEEDGKSHQTRLHVQPQEKRKRIALWSKERWARLLDRGVLEPKLPTSGVLSLIGMGQPWSLCSTQPGGG